LLALDLEYLGMNVRPYRAKIAHRLEQAIHLRPDLTHALLLDR
jgi:hypothetical protein